MDIKKLVGDNIRGYRKRIGWTQEKLAVRSKMNSEHISRMENGTENITLETIQKLASKLGIEVYLLFIKESYYDNN
jgi:transcriptional regulator with XRE-family HTH domain